MIGPDGKVSQLDQKTVTDGQQASEESDDTYTDARIRKAPLPGVTVGAIVEEETSVVDKQPFFTAGGVYRNSYYRSVPIVRAQLVVDVPKDVKLQYRVYHLPSVKISDDAKDGVRHLQFDQAYQPARANSDIDLSTHQFVGPTIEFSTGESWAAVASAYRELAEAHIDPEKVKSMLPAGERGRSHCNDSAPCCEAAQGRALHGPRVWRGSAATGYSGGCDEAPLRRLQGQGRAAGGDAARIGDCGAPGAAERRPRAGCDRGAAGE